MKVCAPLLLLVMAARAAAADPAAADAAADAAMQLGQAGDLAGAAAKFRAAYQQDPTRPQFLCNVGVAYFNAGADLPRAPTRSADDAGRVLPGTCEGGGDAVGRHYKAWVSAGAENA